MLANSYTGIVDHEVSRLIVSRARRLRVGSDDIDDLQQQIVPTLAAFKYDAAMSNGASRTTALTGVIDRQIKTYLRGKRRYHNRLERLRACHIAATRFKWPPSTKPEPVELRVDIAAAMDRLCERDRAICHRLGDGHTIKDIAMALGCGRDTISRAIMRIREVFTRAGLRAWIDSCPADGADQA